MTDADIDQIHEGIEEFIISGNDEVADIWGRYLTELMILKTVLKVARAFAHNSLKDIGYQWTGLTKDELAARLIKDSDNDATTRMFAALVIIRTAETFSPRFDRARFLKACGLGS